MKVTRKHFTIEEKANAVKQNGVYSELLTKIKKIEKVIGE